MPDNGICERFHRTVLDEFYRVPPPRFAGGISGLTRCHSAS